MGERWHKARLGRYGASAPLLLTHHLEARACRLGEHGTDMHVRLYLTNRSTLPIDNLRFVAHLDGQLPLEKPAMVETLRPAVVSKAHTFPIDTVRIELRFPPVSEERLRVQVEYTARSMSPTKHSAVGEVILKPCRED
ncbi:MAG: hypothetical protein NZM28_10515 [Fimbriimonadales bacterium]|nr:hypothetical protein [Fimbriimonadales bacterium]